MERLTEGEVVPATAYPATDDDVAPFVRATGAPGILDVHVHAMPDRLQQAVWRYFDGLEDPPWPVTYRGDLDERARVLAGLGVRAHTALAYAHRPGMLDWLNGFTLGLADERPEVVPTFTLYPEDGVTDAVASALERGGVVCKVHAQLSRYHLTDPRLDDAWRLLAEARTVVVAHVSAVYGVDGGADFCGGDALAAFRRRHPDVVVVVAHLGLPDPDGSMLDVLAHDEGVHADVSMALTDPPFGAAGGVSNEVVTALRGSVADRLLFGSDFPTIPHAYAAQVRGLAALRLDPAGLRAVLHDRAIALLATAGWTP
ncbi:MAG: amidohydrolase family protein [Actinomycetes bacterium]